MRNFRPSIVNKRPDDRVVAGIFPVAGGLGLGVALEVPQIVHHVPRAVDVQVSEVIPVVPVLDVSSMFQTVCIFENLIYVCLGESERFVQVRRRDCIRDKVVGAGEDAFLGDAQTAGDHSKTQGIVVFQRCAHHASNHFQHLGIVAVGAGFGDRHIILIQ